MQIFCFLQLHAVSRIKQGKQREPGNLMLRQFPTNSRECPQCKNTYVLRDGNQRRALPCYQSEEMYILNIYSSENRIHNTTVVFTVARFCLCATTGLKYKFKNVNRCYHVMSIYQVFFNTPASHGMLWTHFVCKGIPILSLASI